jgi:hypothetical protein
MYSQFGVHGSGSVSYSLVGSGVAVRSFQFPLNKYRYNLLQLAVYTDSSNPQNPNILQVFTS